MVVLIASLYLHMSESVRGSNIRQDGLLPGNRGRSAINLVRGRAVVVVAGSAGSSTKQLPHLRPLLETWKADRQSLMACYL